jgi:hypothetical protein
MKKLWYYAPATLHDMAVHKAIVAVPDHTKTDLDDDCAICLNKLEAEGLCKISGCGHYFHHECILEAMQHSSRCPLCSKHLAEPQGKMPSGEMSISMLPSVSCGGYGPGSIEIYYHIFGDVQKDYHRLVRLIRK